MLHPDDLIPLVNLVKANQTSDMYVKEDGEGMSLACALLLWLGLVYLNYAFVQCSPCFLSNNANM
jgi:hypothetical protein